MSEPNYTITVTESERTAFAKVLGGLVTKFINAPIFVEAEPCKVCGAATKTEPQGRRCQSCGAFEYVTIEAPSGGTQQARSVLSPPSSPAVAPAEGRANVTQPNAAAPAPIEQRDRWARDRSAKEAPNPKGHVVRVVNLCKTEQRPARKAGGKPYLKVTWQSESSGFVDANCFDNKLWPWLINQCGKRTTLYLVKSGEYLNVVGVRA